MTQPDPEVEERLSWTEFQGSSILAVDLRGLDRDGILAATQRYGQVLRPLPPQSVRLLVLHGASEFHPDALTRSRSVMIEVSSRILRSALVGPEGMMKMALERYFDTASLLGQDLRQRGRGYPEGAEAQAQDWLTQP